MRRPVFFALLTAIALAAMFAGRAAQPHDLPGEAPVTAFFDSTEPEPELLLRVPLVLLTNVNLPKRGPGYLDLANLGDGVARAERAVASAFQISTEGRPLAPVAIASRISLPSEPSFANAATARRAVLGPPLPHAQNVFWNQGYLDLRLVFGEQPPGQTYSLRTDLPPGMAERVLISVGIIAPERPLRTLSLSGATAEVALDPRWYQAGAVFLTKGVEHILTGYDHLLFLLCLILPLLSDTRRLLVVVTAFTVGHTTTLIPAALGMVPEARWFSPTIEALIAASIVYMAVENVLGTRGRFRWGLAFGFGLIHGFGFASTLTDVLQFAGSHLLASLVFFNVGIEIGQILVLAAVLPVLALILRPERAHRYGIIVISVLAGHEAWHWMTERVGQIELPAAFAIGWTDRIFSILTWIGVALLLLLIAWAASLGRKGFRVRAAPDRTNRAPATPRSLKTSAT